MKDYSKYCFEDLEYHGLLPKQGKLRVDAKRFIKIDHPEDEITVALMKPRKTVYFIPEKKIDTNSCLIILKMKSTALKIFGNMKYYL